MGPVMLSINFWGSFALHTVPFSKIESLTIFGSIPGVFFIFGHFPSLAFVRRPISAIFDCNGLSKIPSRLFLARFYDLTRPSAETCNRSLEEGTARIPRFFECPVCFSPIWFDSLPPVYVAVFKPRIIARLYKSRIFFSCTLHLSPFSPWCSSSMINPDCNRQCLGNPLIIRFCAFFLVHFFLAFVFFFCCLARPWFFAFPFPFHHFLVRRRRSSP